jgi:hypothetical protein
MWRRLTRTHYICRHERGQYQKARKCTADECTAILGGICFSRLYLHLHGYPPSMPANSALHWRFRAGNA